MAQAHVVADAALIALGWVDQLELLPALFGRLIVPPAVVAAWLILDDAPARALARNLELHVLGTAAVLLEAKSAGLIPLVRPILDALRARGFRLRKDIYEEVLQAAGEAQS
jgi:predicted nucleic acid-binding protein